MDKKHRDLLRKNRISLVQDLEATQLLSYLYQEDILSENDRDSIKAEKTRGAKAEKLLDILPRRGKKAFDVFCQALATTDGQGHLVDLLKPNESISSGNVSSTTAGNAVEVNDGVANTSHHVAVKSNVETSSQVKKNVLPDTDEDFVYPMNCKPHGWCLIVNNVDFETLRRRGGSDLDAKQLSELFTQLHYKVKVVRNQTGKQLKDTLFQFAKMSDHKAADSMVLCLLSHGLEGQIYGVDGVLVSIPDLLALFNGYMAKDLIGKPKLFFIQACRGSDYDHGTDVTDGGHSANVETEYHVTRSTNELLAAAFPNDKPETVDEPETIPAEADMLVAYSTVPGYVSWSHLQKGSWFVQAMVDVFSAYAKTEDVVSMLVRVNGKVAREFESFNRKKQMPAPVIMLTRKVFFFAQS
ncbi:unnamed protein product [Porites lobata]|uniref:Uncharacterized protein n=1 Tax=Porites lobata TaxID=104759 RepID=A0ABN8N0T0_9CNID|nr:unnamed protein product [Porites lobata]